MNAIESSEDFEFEDETISERLWGLTEMFPEPIRNVTSIGYEKTTSLSKTMFKAGSSLLWVAASSFTILILPIICENERSTMEEQQKMQQRELFLGPSAAASSSIEPGNMPGIPFGLTPSK